GSGKGFFKFPVRIQTEDKGKAFFRFFSGDWHLVSRTAQLPLIEGTHLLAGVAAEQAISHRPHDIRLQGIAVLDGPVGKAAAGIQDTRPAKRRGWAGIEAFLTTAAEISFQWMVG